MGVWERIRREPRKPMRIVEMTKPTLETFDHDVVAKGLVVRSKRTDDGIDIAPIIVYRNRSKHNIEIKALKAKYVLNGKTTDGQSSHGFTGVIGAEKDSAAHFHFVRIYNQDGRASGEALIQFTYGETKETAGIIITITYTFKTLAAPKTKGKEENVAFEYELDVRYKNSITLNRTLCE